MILKKHLNFALLLAQVLFSGPSGYMPRPCIAIMAMARL